MIVTYTKTGSHHQSAGQPCQDAVYFEDTPELIFLALADGVSACGNSHIGAELACRTAAEYVMTYAPTFQNCDTTKIAYLILDQVRYELERKAEQMGWDAESLASTLSFCCIRKTTREMLAFSLGDGGIRTMEQNQSSMLLSPTAGPFGPANTLTRNGHRAAQVKLSTLPGSTRIFLCSDGILKLLKNHPRNGELEQAMDSGDFEGLKQLLDQIDSLDDCGFVAC